uniref:Pecanex-like protein n=1 Tax=Schistocephalus solidus TaxID=70667 RepID=A0A183T9J3_SCHSO
LAMIRFMFAALLVACAVRLNLTYWSENECLMTYMFSIPHFMVIIIPSSLPVLFIPGSQGTAKEMRSLASVALQMTLSRSTNISFDYFALDFNQVPVLRFASALIFHCDVILLYVRVSKWLCITSVVGVGSEMLDIHQRVRSFWNAINTSVKFEHLAFLSITGGSRDLQVIYFPVVNS